MSMLSILMSNSTSVPPESQSQVVRGGITMAVATGPIKPPATVDTVTRGRADVFEQCAGDWSGVRHRAA